MFRGVICYTLPKLLEQLLYYSKMVSSRSFVFSLVLLVSSSGTRGIGQTFWPLPSVPVGAMFFKVSALFLCEYCTDTE